jgi:hypothetical protein
MQVFSTSGFQGSEENGRKWTAFSSGGGRGVVRSRCEHFIHQIELPLQLPKVIYVS